ncbi:predicted protein [Histoplasma mississippiense (nom. inval.)]|uniref:predicted protein n=1 Tax=Ajellomyces capsulatus (strain NAm1 / WU24) TaxID=2059318 RepID=UPI000157BCB6|nr:predicted protein [Histoplasma mississippiense (nom. inval.)]EDN06111.1 predicted protein [Histoplasma mississippiense (nom. inval.)]
MASSIIALPISAVDELIQLKMTFDAQLQATDFTSETPSYLALSDKCKAYMIALQRYMFRSIDQKATKLRRYYQRQTVLQEAGNIRDYAAIEDGLEALKVENHPDETTRAGRLLMAVGTSILRIEEKAESPEEMQKMVVEEVNASEAEVLILRQYKAELESKQASLEHGSMGALNN